MAISSVCTTINTMYKNKKLKKCLGMYITVIMHWHTIKYCLLLHLEVYRCNFFWINSSSVKKRVWWITYVTGSDKIAHLGNEISLDYIIIYKLLVVGQFLFNHTKCLPLYRAQRCIVLKMPF